MYVQSDFTYNLGPTFTFKSEYNWENAKLNNTTKVHF